MTSNSSIRISRRTLGLQIAALPFALGAAPSAPAQGAASGSDGLSHSAAAIHQEISFKASRRRVYHALTTASEFDAVSRLSDALALMTAPGAKPTSISGEAGGAFTLFGGYISGRILELQPNERLVQAWRTASWKPGAYSIAHFALLDDGAGSKLNFEHRGFPDSEGEHLAGGWQVHYWTPLAKFLAPA
jgi:activator of HSP90 ATPase